MARWVTAVFLIICLCELLALGNSLPDKASESDKRVAEDVMKSSRWDHNKRGFNPSLRDYFRGYNFKRAKSMVGELDKHDVELPEVQRSSWDDYKSRNIDANKSWGIPVIHYPMARESDVEAAKRMDPTPEDGIEQFNDVIYYLKTVSSQAAAAPDAQ